jgi:hypothetical protein
MSTQYNGDGTIPQATSGYNPLAISSSSSATPIEITTGAPHGYATGDTVAIEGHGNAAANGLWQITKTSSTKFTLDGSVGSASGGATGYAINYAVNPLFTLPSDLVDLMDVSSVNPAFEGAANAIPFMYERVGAYSLYNIGRVDHSDAIDQGTVGTASVPNTATWTTLATFNYQWSFGRDVNIYNTDILKIQVQAFVVVGTGSQSNAVGLGANFNGGGDTLITGSAQAIYAASTQKSMVLDATLYASDFTTTQLNSMVLSIMGFNDGVGAQTFTIENPYHVNVYHYRSNA